MADTSPPAGLLDRAGRVFSLAWQLARAFTEEYNRQGTGHKTVDPTAWGRQRPAFEEYCAAVLELREVVQQPPAGLEPVAEALRQAAQTAKQIRDTMQTVDGQMWQSFIEFRFHLNSVGATGEQALERVRKAQRFDDPFAFLETPAPPTNGIDTTPTVPKPPAPLIEAAERHIPHVLSNLQPNHEGSIEMLAAALATQLQKSNHTLAAAHWAIHDAVRAGRLSTGRVEVHLPTIIKPRGGGLPAALFPNRDNWYGAECPTKGMKPIPNGKPAPFDCFKVVATEALWAWYRATGEAEGGMPSGAGVGHVPGTLGDAKAVSQDRKPSEDAAAALLRVFTNGLSDSRFVKAAELLADTELTANDKLTKIDAQMPFPATASAEQLGELLGVSKQAILKTEWWVQNRRGERESEIGRRRSGHKKRAAGYEPPDED